MLVVTLAVFLPVSPLAAGIVFLGMLLLPIASKPAMGKNVKVQLGQLRKYDQVGVHFEHALRGLNTLKIFGGDQRQADDLAEESEGFRRITMGVLAGRNTTSWLLAALMDGLGRESLVLTITHCLAGVRRADSILFLEGGRLVESEDFRELMDVGGRFATQWKEQARCEDPEEGA